MTIPFTAQADAFRPSLSKRVDRPRLISDVAGHFGLSVGDAKACFDECLRIHIAKGYKDRLKHLSMEEAYIIYLAMTLKKPKSFVEIGPQFGRSTRRIIDMAKELGLDCKITCFDVVDAVDCFTKDEATLVIKDVTNSFKEDVLNALSPSVIYLDAHPHGLLKNVISGVMSSGWDGIMTIHDCGLGLCNPRMTLPKSNPRVTSNSGVWERHVLAEEMGLQSPLDPRLDGGIVSKGFRLRVFNTQHGLAVLSKA